MKKGWFKIDGVQDGDRTVQQQVLGLDLLIASIAGKSVLDLGCAEGLIAKRLLEAGASRVVGIEVVPDHVEEAKRQCDGLSAVFLVGNLNSFPVDNLGRFDVVLMLAILHKLRNPFDLIRKAIAVAPEVVVVRTAKTTPGFVCDSRSGNAVFDFQPLLRAAGYHRKTVKAGPFDEWTGYFIRRM